MNTFAVIPVDNFLAGHWILVFLPTELFIILLFYFMRWLRKDGFKLAEALSVDPTDQQAQQLQTVALAQAPPANAAGAAQPPQPQPVVKRSSSRLAAFLSAIAAIVIGISITTCYAYSALTEVKANIPDFQNLWPVLASLGIGVIPYATKVINEK
ncbi:hypothetical protein KK062_26160 [Fulvivirgaceae bacterium PWU5]|uniref:Uncharacterized protein n=1 Tax=Dawidia cretensis TaxID=2782350 RepID=A0AAP2E425_9BACT|nr:hypothetical protein [Dawidia cretensis]MBT1711753.1 hypothetical protein [Dawidia cretensis]